MEWQLAQLLYSAIIQVHKLLLKIYLLCPFLQSCLKIHLLLNSYEYTWDGTGRVCNNILKAAVWPPLVGVYFQGVLALSYVPSTSGKDRPQFLLFSQKLSGLSKLLAIPFLLESCRHQVGSMVSVSLGLNFSSSPAFFMGHNPRHTLAYQKRIAIISIQHQYSRGVIQFM